MFRPRPSNFRIPNYLLFKPISQMGKLAVSDVIRLVAQSKQRAVPASVPRLPGAEASFLHQSEQGGASGLGPQKRVSHLRRPTTPPRPLRQKSCGTGPSALPPLRGFGARFPGFAHLGPCPVPHLHRARPRAAGCPRAQPLPVQNRLR